MWPLRRLGRWAVALAAAALALCPAGAEVVEEIVAWVDGDIITLSEFRAEEQAVVSELYRQYTGEELDKQVETARAGLLRQMIDRKILLHRAERMFNIERMAEGYLRMYKEQSGISDEEFDKLLAQQRMTVKDFQRALIERFAPDEVIRMEVSNRVAVGEDEIAAHYESNRGEFRVPGEAELREIVLLAEGAAKEQRRAEAEALRERAASEGADFEALAREHSQAGTAAAGGLLGRFKRGELAKELEKVAFSLPAGRVSQVLEMPYGYHILQVVDRREDRVKPLEEVREELRLKLEDRRYLEALDRFLAKARLESDWEVNPKYRHRLPEGVEG